VFLSFFGGLWIGPVFDINGPRMLLITGSFCLVLGLLLMGQSTRKWHAGTALRPLTLVQNIGTLCSLSAFSQVLARP
jgi:hypothetical protein